MTANGQRGEVTFTAGGKSYVLRLTINAIVALEKQQGATFGQVSLRIQQQSVSAMVGLLWAGLQGHHADEFPTVKEVGALADSLGPTLMDALADMSGVLVELIEANQPPEELLAKPGDPADPQSALAGGTGSASSSTAAALV